MNEFINCSLCNYKSTGLQLLSSWRDKVETHKVPVVLPNLVKAIFVHTSGTSSLFLSESLGAIFFLLLCFPCCFYQDGWSTAIKVLPSVWDSEFLITCFAAFLVRFSICLLFSVSLPEIRLWFLCWRATCSTLQGCVNFLYRQIVF